MTSRRISFATDQNEIIQPLLTDLYQLKMAYAYWKSEKSSARAVFDLFFRKNPFEGEFTIFAGLEEVLKFLQKFRYSKSDIQYIREILPPTVENEFFEYLENLNLKEVSVYAVPEGTVVFPIEPLIRVEGPLIAAQLLETTLLNLVNYACLVTTNAARYRIAAGSLQLYEFGLRRAQGPDGGLSASRYCYIGGFDGTSNVLAGKMYDIPVRGTQAHSYITSFTNLRELSVTTLIPKDGSEPLEFMQPALEWRNKLPHMGKTIGQPNDGELAAFISYAIAFPSNFIALVDTYNVLKSGIFNFCAVALTLNQFGHDAIGIRLDSGDLAYISNLCREYFTVISQQYDIPSFADKLIMASSNIDDDTILSLSEQGHSINAFGIGTHLVTCQKQPALGGVYKMVEMEGDPRMKLSHDVEKISIPGRKEIYRLYGVSGYALMDILQRTVEECPAVNKKVLCRHPFQENKRAFVVPTEVEKLLVQYWKDGRLCQSLPSIKQIQERVENSLKILRPDVKRSLNPTPYKVSVSDSLYNFFHYLWLKNIPVGELS